MNSRRLFRLSLPIKRYFGLSTPSTFVSLKEKSVPPATEVNQYEALADTITPYWRLDYSEQIYRKKQWCRGVVRSIKSKKLPRSRTLIHDVLPSPVTESYRNKDEFSVRKGVDGNDKTVGFFIGKPSKGEVICVPATKLISLKDKHILLSQVYQDLIRSSPLKACHDLHDGGFWRNLIVRSNKLGDLMAVVIVHSKGSSNEELEETKGIVKDHFLKHCPSITSLYLQACPHVRCQSDQAPFILLHGEEYLYETMGDIQVRISPDSFFQVNTDAALLLYEATARLLKLNSRCTVLDLCCGIGSFSLHVSKLVRGCIGIEFLKTAIEDAKFNAEINEIKNCLFLDGRIENKLNSAILKMDAASDMVPFLNPGRAGVHKEVIKEIRKNPCIERMAFISCKADSIGAMNNFVQLCCPDFHDSRPFFLTDVQAVDLFPQTDHCELILIFQR